KMDEFDTTVNRLAHTYDMTRDQVIALIESDQELNLATASTKEVTEAFEGALGAVAEKAGTTKEGVGGLAEALGLSGEAFEAAVEAAQEYGDSVEDALRSYLDLAQVQDLKFGSDLSVNEAQLASNLEKIKQFYSDHLTGARQFSS